LNGAAMRVRSQRGIRERFKHGLEISRRYDRQFRKIFRDAGLPEDLAYLPHVESSFQPAAKSSAGAVGMWQFTKAQRKLSCPAQNDTPRSNCFAKARP
jgi:membrane-bound lytic murein transglycosylase D